MATKTKSAPKGNSAHTKAPLKASKKTAPPAAKAKKTSTKPVAKTKSTPVAKVKPSVAQKSHSNSNQATKKPAVKGAPPTAGFLAKQRQRLLVLKDTLLDSMNGVAKDSLRSRAEGSEASAFGMHQADAGSDAYDRDFALSLLSQEQDSLYEIDEALKRIETGSYGVCEMCSKSIPHARLEALPFTRFTVDCQSEIEKRNRYSRVRQPVASLFGLGDDESGDDDDDSSNDSKD